MSLSDTLRAAQAEGLLPPDATLPAPETRPWPVVLLTALGAWLAAIPLMAMVGLLLGDLVARGLGTYAVGALLLAGAVVVLRRAEVPVFVEQLAVPALLSGAGTLAFGLGRDLPPQAAAAVLTALALAIALLIDRAWLRVLLGAAAAGLFGFAVLPLESRWFEHHGTGVLWLSLHASFALWVAVLVVQQRVLGNGQQARAARAVESIATGWLLSVLAGLAWLSGMTFLVGGVLGGGLMGEVTRELAHGGVFSRATPLDIATRVLSAALAVAAAVWLGRAWPTLRGLPGVLMAAVLALLALAIPELGAALLALAVTLCTRRWRVAGAAGLAALWMLGSFYYALDLPLAHKAVVLVLAGAKLGALSWWVLRGPAAAPAHAPMGSRAAAALIALTLVATLAVANWAIRDKERLIAQGAPLFVELAPVDPRSLMQGDFMRLRFTLPEPGERQATGLLRGERLYAVATRDARGVAQIPRLLNPGETLAAGEFPLQLTPKGGDWVLVTDAWFFAEGDAARWEAARYGEFRVTPDGRALLVGMADAQLKPIRP